MKVVFQITDQGAWAEIEQPDGSMKRWSEELTPEEYVQLVTAGAMLQKGTTAHCIMANSDRTNKLLLRMEALLDSAEDYAREALTSAKKKQK